MGGWYGLYVDALKVLGVFCGGGRAARGLVAFGTWRTSWRDRLVGNRRLHGGHGSDPADEENLRVAARADR